MLNLVIGRPLHSAPDRLDRLMTAVEFKEWRKALGFNQTDAAKALGISVATVGNYEIGRRRDDGWIVEIPSRIALACDSIALREAVDRGDATILRGEVRERVIRMSAILKANGWTT